MLNQQAVLQNTNLGQLARTIMARTLTHNHGALHRFAPRQELGLRHHAGTLALLLTPLAASTTLRLQARGPLDRLRFLDRLLIRLLSLLGLLLFDVPLRRPSRPLRTPAGCTRRLEDRCVDLSGFLHLSGLRFGFSLLLGGDFLDEILNVDGCVLGLCSQRLLEVSLDLLGDLVDLVFYVLAHAVANLLIRLISSALRIGAVLRRRLSCRGLLQCVQELLRLSTRQRRCRNLNQAKIAQRDDQFLGLHAQGLSQREDTGLVLNLGTVHQLLRSSRLLRSFLHGLLGRLLRSSGLLRSPTTWLVGGCNVVLFRHGNLLFN